MASGRKFMMNGVDYDYSTAILEEYGNSKHFTFIFNTFVMMQIFNFLNARKLKDEWNTFGGNCNYARYLEESHLHFDRHFYFSFAAYSH